MEQRGSVPRCGIWYRSRADPSDVNNDSDSDISSESNSDSDCGSDTTDEVDWQAIGAIGLLTTPRVPLPPTPDSLPPNFPSVSSFSFSDWLVDIAEDGSLVENVIDNEVGTEYNYTSLEAQDTEHPDKCDGNVSEDQVMSDCEQEDLEDEPMSEYEQEGVEEEEEEFEEEDESQEEDESEDEAMECFIDDLVGKQGVAPKRKRAKTEAEKAARLAEQKAATAERRRIKQEIKDQEKREKEAATIVKRLKEIEELQAELAQRKKEKKELIKLAVSEDLKRGHDQITMRIRNAIATRTQTHEDLSKRNLRQNARRAAEKMGIDLVEPDEEKTPEELKEERRLIVNMGSRNRQEVYRTTEVEERIQVYPVAPANPDTPQAGTNTAKPLSILTTCRFSNRHEEEGFVQEHTHRNTVVTAKFVRDFVAGHPAVHTASVVWNGRKAWKGFPWTPIIQGDEIYFPNRAGGQPDDIAADTTFLTFFNTRPNQSTVIWIVRGIDGASISPETWIYMAVRFPHLNIKIVFTCTETFVNRRTNAFQKYFWHRTNPFDGKLYAFFSLSVLADHLTRRVHDSKCQWLENEWRVGILARQAISVALIGGDDEDISDARRQFALLSTARRNDLPNV